MGNCLKTCYENVNELGVNPKRFTCHVCNKKKWRNTKSYIFVKKHGCNICRLKAKYKHIIEERYGRNIKVSVPMDNPQTYKTVGRYYEAEI